MKPRIYKFNNSTLTIIFGDITHSQAEVIASSDDTLITMGGGVSAAIRRAGGEQIRTDAQKQTPAMIGDVVVSTAGNLPYQKFIFHCLTIDLNSKIKKIQNVFGNNVQNSNSESTNKEQEPTKKLLNEEKNINNYILRHSINKCFQLLQALELNSIAFPAIGAGSAHIPLEEVATTMADVISANLSKYQKSYDVELYLKDKYNKLEEIDYISMFENFAIKSTLAKIENKREQGDLITENIENNSVIDTKKLPKRSEMKHDIFISYSRKDSEKVKDVTKYLEQVKIPYWIDKDGIYSGNNYKEFIVDAIEVAKVVIFISSENSNKSLNVIREIGYAVSKDKIIIPLLLDETQFAKSIRLDISDIDQVVWYNNSNEAKEKLLTSLAYTLGKQ